MNSEISSGATPSEYSQGEHLQSEQPTENIAVEQNIATPQDAEVAVANVLSDENTLTIDAGSNQTAESQTPVSSDIVPDATQQDATQQTVALDSVVTEQGQVATDVATTDNVEQTFATPATSMQNVEQPTALQTAESPEPSDMRDSPQEERRDPPRPLVPGAFLGGEYEIKQVISRGFTNLYLAYAGDYSAPEPKLIAERDVPPQTHVAEDASTQVPVEVAENADAAALSGAFVEDVDALPDESEDKVVAEISPVETSTSNLEAITPNLLPEFQFFTQDDREYLVFEYVASRALQDFRAPTNDEQLLRMLSTLANGLAELDRQGLCAELSTDTLRVDAQGDLRYVGFASPKNAESPDALDALRDGTRFLLKRVFAESSTMRLDDEFGALALAQETKALANRIDEKQFENIAEAAASIAALVPSTRLQVQSAILSDVGQEREINEDSGMILKIQRHATLDRREIELYVVADGMGGHEGGEVASDLTMRALQTHLDAKSQIDWNDNVAVRNALLEVIDAVNADVVALTETPRYKGTRAKPGSTLVFALRLGARVFVGNVGDSRAYKYSNGVLERISKDHSYVQSLIDRGEITEEEAFDHPEGSIITAHIGYPKLKTRDVFLRLFKAGDRLLLVSDGVTDMLRDVEYIPHLQHQSPEDVCHAFVDASNEAGGFDNITVVCVDFA